MLITCVKCNKRFKLSEGRLHEDATLTCPSCGAEFSLTAEMTKSPGQEGEEGGELGLDTNPIDNLDTQGPEGSLPMRGAGAPPMQSELPPEESRQPQLTTRVFQCSRCQLEWIGSSSKKCPDPECGSSDIMISTKTIQERCQDAIDEANRGVPVGRCLDRLLGTFSKVE